MYLFPVAFNRSLFVTTAHLFGFRYDFSNLNTFTSTFVMPHTTETQ